MTIRIRTEKIKELLFCMFIYATIIVDVFRIANNAFFHLGESASTVFRNVVYIFIFVLMIICIREDKNSIKRFLILSAAYVTVVLISFIINQDLGILIKNSVLIFFSRIAPAYIIASSMSDFKGAIERVIRWKWVVLIYILVFLSVGISNTRYYYMNVGYNLLFPTLILLFSKGEKPILAKGIGVVSSVVILLFCARGTTLVLIPSVLLFLVIKTFEMKNKKKRFAIIGTMLIVGILLIINLDSIFELLYNQFPNSRTLYYIMHGDIMDSSGRNNFYSAGITELMNNPFTIRGILGDRFYFGKCFSLADFEGAFAHNVILEVMLQFGVLIGFVISFLFLKHVGQAFYYGLKMRKDDVNIMICAIIIPSFLICLTTASYLSSIETLFMIGICSSIISQKKRIATRSSYEKNTHVGRLCSTDNCN